MAGSANRQGGVGAFSQGQHAVGGRGRERVGQDSDTLRIGQAVEALKPSENLFFRPSRRVDF